MLILTDQSFDEELKKSVVPMLVDFWASWCGPCQMLAPILEEMAKEYKGKIIIGKVDVDANPQTAAKFGVMSIPTLILFDKNKQAVKQMVGFQDKASLQKQITALF